MDDKKTLVEEPFRKYRGVGKCYSRGLSLLSDNFRSFFRFLFLVALLCALVSTLISIAQLFPYEHSLGALEPYKNWLSALFLLIDIAVYGLFLSHVYTLIRLKAATYDLSKLTRKFFYAESRKNMKVLFGWYAIAVPLLALTAVISPITYLFIMLVLPCLMLSGKKFWRGVWFGLRLGCRFFFRNLTMLLFLVLSVGLACLLVNAPLIACYLVEFQVEAARSMGDSVVIPDAYYYVAPVVAFICTFLSLFISIAFHTPIAYLYVSAQVAYEEELANTGKH